MVNIILTALLIALAALFKAAADIMRNTYPNSIFARWNPQFWDARKSFSNKRIFNYPVDGWHISNSLMLACFMGAVIIGFICPIALNWWQTIAYFLVMGVWFNVVFNLCYDHILRRKK